MSNPPRKVAVMDAGSGIGAATAAHFHRCGDFVSAVDVGPQQTPASQFVRCDPVYTTSKQAMIRYAKRRAATAQGAHGHRVGHRSSRLGRRRLDNRSGHHVDGGSISSITAGTE